jgi:hypothetical protein
MIETPAMKEAFEVIGFSGVAVLVIGWLVVSFSKPGPRRERVEWVAACGMYLALLSLFVHLTIRAYERDSEAAMLAFGFLVLFFTSGFGVCVNQTITALRGGSTKGAESATN